MRSGRNYCGAKEGLRANSMQSLDLFGVRTRNRTGTSLRTGDFRSLVVALNFLGLFAQQSSGIFGRKQPFSTGGYRPKADILAGVAI